MALRSLLRRLVRSDRGVALVEFALVLPLLVLLFAVIIEGGRMMWNYQTAVADVRDAARYLGRVVSSNECPGRGSNYPLTGHDAALTEVRNRLAASFTDNALQGLRMNRHISLFPNAAGAVTASLDCSSGTPGQFRVDPTPILTVSAQFRIDFPFEGLFDLAGGGFAPFLVTTITDESRVFGS